MSGSFRILLIEDNPADAHLIEAGLKRDGRDCAVRVFGDGPAALEYAFREGNWKKESRLNLIILDLNLPGMSGVEILKRLKGDERTRSIPVIVFSCSNAEADVNRCYDLHANCYIEKPPDLEGISHVLKSIESFWTSVAQISS